MSASQRNLVTPTRGLPRLTVSALLLLLAVSLVNAQKSGSGPKLDFLKGPATARVGAVADLALPSGYVFLDAKNTRAFLKSRGEPVGGHEVGFLTTVLQNWSVLFIYDPSGYVMDDERNKLNPDQLLAAIKQGAAGGNRERERHGTPTVEVVGWELRPRYDPVAHSLDWAVRGVSQGRPVVNYNARLLGRNGVMQAILIVAPDKLRETLPQFRDSLAGFSFLPGQKYAEYRPGDRVAAAGLSALVVGLPSGTSATTLLAWLLALLVLAGAAFAFLRRRSPRHSQARNK